MIDSSSLGDRVDILDDDHVTAYKEVQTVIRQMSKQLIFMNLSLIIFC